MVAIEQGTTIGDSGVTCNAVGWATSDDKG